MNWADLQVKNPGFEPEHDLETFSCLHDDLSLKIWLPPQNCTPTAGLFGPLNNV